METFNIEQMSKDVEAPAHYVKYMLGILKDEVGFVKSASIEEAWGILVEAVQGSQKEFLAYENLSNCVSQKIEDSKTTFEEILELFKYIDENTILERQAYEKIIKLADTKDRLIMVYNRASKNEYVPEKEMKDVFKKLATYYPCKEEKKDVI